MRSLIPYLLSILCLSCVVLTTSCEEDPTAEEIFLDKISHTWVASSIVVDATTVNGAFDGFTLTVKKDKTFTTTNGNAPIWPASGTFVLQPVNSTAGFNLQRSDGTVVEVEQLSETTLVLTFHYDASGGRIAGVTGNFSFTLTKQ